MAQVASPLSEKEMFSIFIDTLETSFYDKLIRSVSSNFSNMVIIGERVEGGLRNWNIAHNFVGTIGAIMTDLEIEVKLMRPQCIPNQANIRVQIDASPSPC